MRWILLVFLAIVCGIADAVEFDADGVPIVHENISTHEAHGQRSNSNHTIHGNHSPKHEEHHGVHIVSWRWKFVGGPLTIVIWLLAAAYAKTAFNTFTIVTDNVPDSALLIVLGLVVGLVSHYLFALKLPSMSPDIFFLYLLPPIVFEAGFFLPSRAFFDNLGTILMYAVIGTLFNTIVLALVLYVCLTWFGWFSISWNLLHLLLFASLISAVDPVAVLSIFEEIHVNEMLYIVVFGESLLNDAVTVVLYNVFSQFVEAGPESVDAVNCVKGVISFVVVAIGGVLLGGVFGIIASFTTTLTRRVKILNPVFVFVISYGSYLTAEMFHLSGILAIVFCGVTMRQYVKENVSFKSNVTVKYLSKMVASCSEAIIFMFLGTSTVHICVSLDAAGDHIVFTEIDWGFVGMVVFLTFVIRLIGVWVQTHFVNKLRTRKFTLVDKLIMGYGGLRGAIAYGLVASLNNDTPGKSTFIMATIAVILFTVFVQGTTIKPLVNLLKIKKQNMTQSVNTQMFDRMLDHWLAGVESICGIHGHHWVRDKFEHINSTLLKRILTINTTAPGSSRSKSCKDMRLVHTAQRLAIKEAVSDISRKGSQAELSGMGSQRSSMASLNGKRNGSTASFASQQNGPRSPKVVQSPTDEFRKRIAAKNIVAWSNGNTPEEKPEIDLARVFVEAKPHSNIREDSEADLAEYFNEYREAEKKQKSEDRANKTVLARQEEGNSSKLYFDYFPARKKLQNYREQQKTATVKTVDEYVNRPKRPTTLCTHVDELENGQKHKSESSTTKAVEKQDSVKTNETDLTPPEGVPIELNNVPAAGTADQNTTDQTAPETPVNVTRQRTRFTVSVDSDSE